MLENEHTLFGNELDEHIVQLDGSEIYPDAGLIQMDGEFVLMDELSQAPDERAGQADGLFARERCFSCCPPCRRAEQTAIAVRPRYSPSAHARRSLALRARKPP